MLVGSNTHTHIRHGRHRRVSCVVSWRVCRVVRVLAISSFSLSVLIIHGTITSNVMPCVDDAVCRLSCVRTCVRVCVQVCAFSLCRFREAIHSHSSSTRSVRSHMTQPAWPVITRQTCQFLQTYARFAGKLHPTSKCDGRQAERDCWC